MATNTTVKCDGCDKELNQRFKNVGNPNAKMTISRRKGNTNQDEVWDFCEECMKSFYEWLKQRRKAKKVKI